MVKRRLNQLAAGHGLQESEHRPQHLRQHPSNSRAASGIDNQKDLDEMANG